MSQVVTSHTLHHLRFKAALYEATIEPVLNRYEIIVIVLSLVVIALTVLIGILLALYWCKSEECKYYRQSLNANFGWWK